MAKSIHGFIMDQDGWNDNYENLQLWRNLPSCLGTDTRYSTHSLTDEETWPSHNADVTYFLKTT
jgi:hypothetical protein